MLSRASCREELKDVLVGDMAVLFSRSPTVNQGNYSALISLTMGLIIYGRKGRGGEEYIPFLTLHITTFSSNQQFQNYPNSWNVCLPVSSSVYLCSILWIHVSSVPSFLPAAAPHVSKYTGNVYDWCLIHDCLFSFFFSSLFLLLFLGGYHSPLVILSQSSLVGR